MLRDWNVIKIWVTVRQQVNVFGHGTIIKMGSGVHTHTHTALHNKEEAAWDVGENTADSDFKALYGSLFLSLSSLI